MLNNFITKIALYLLKKNTLSEKNKAKVLGALLENIGALPLRTVIHFDEKGTLKINGKALSIEQAVALRDSAIAYKDSFAGQLVDEQLRFLAVELGVHQGITLERIIFSKAALWLIEEKKRIIDTLVP
jgi:hypothetical protein